MHRIDRPPHVVVDLRRIDVPDRAERGHRVGVAPIDAQIDNRLNWEAASGTGVPGAYAQVIRPGRTHVRGYTYR